MSLEEILAKNWAGPFGEISFKRPKKDEVVLTVSSTGYKVEHLTGFSSVDPTKTSNESLKQIFFELRTFAPDAAVFTSVVQPGSHEITDVSSGNDTDTADEKNVDINPLPERLSSSFDLSLVN